MKYATLALFLCIISCHTNAQSLTYETFDFIYIDNSRTTADDGLSQEQIDRIEALATEADEDGSGFLIVYASNDNNPRITTNAQKIGTWLNNLLQNDMPFPGDKFAEKKQVREALYSSMFEVSRKVNFHFFITDQYAPSIEDRHSAMISMLTNEFIQTLDFKGDAVANIYVNNRQERKIDLNKVRDSLTYNNPFEPLNVDVTYNIVELKL